MSSASASAPAAAPPPAGRSCDDDGPTLRELIASRCCKRLDVGTAVLPRPLLEDDSAGAGGDGRGAQGDDVDVDVDVDALDGEATRYARVLRDEFNAVVVEHHLKWTPLCETQPGPISADAEPCDRVGRYDFHHADSIVDWALSRGMRVKGHVLCWHVTTPAFVGRMDAGEVREQLRRHIYTTMAHFRGRIKIWDVVNESLAPDGSLARNVFLEKLGPGYIEDCFRWAHDADPGAFLIYNDNKVEGSGAKSDGFYNLLKDLKERGVPVHGAGIQAHFNAAGVGIGRPPTPRAVRAQIRRLGDLGLKVNISEMDVRVSKLPPHQKELRRLAQRQIYHDIVAAAVSEPAFDGVWLWGFTDRHTWVTDFYYEDEPLLFDGNYARKDCYYAFRDALATVCEGGRVGGGVTLDSDVDLSDGKPWGHRWMQPEPQSSDEEDAKAKSGDSRPDWLQSG